MKRLDGIAARQFARRAGDRLARIADAGDDLRQSVTHVLQRPEQARGVTGPRGDAHRQIAGRDAVRDMRGIAGLAAELTRQPPCDEPCERAAGQERRQHEREHDRAHRLEPRRRFRHAVARHFVLIANGGFERFAQGVAGGDHALHHRVLIHAGRHRLRADLNLNVFVPRLLFRAHVRDDRTPLVRVDRCPEPIQILMDIDERIGHPLLQLSFGRRIGRKSEIRAGKVCVEPILVGLFDGEQPVHLRGAEVGGDAVHLRQPPYADAADDHA
jgi:hypothetical protein